jgi:hypothetical protein
VVIVWHVWMGNTQYIGIWIGNTNYTELHGIVPSYFDIILDQFVFHFLYLLHNSFEYFF